MWSAAPDDPKILSTARANYIYHRDTVQSTLPILTVLILKITLWRNRYIIPTLWMRWLRLRGRVIYSKVPQLRSAEASIPSQAGRPRAIPLSIISGACLPSANPVWHKTLDYWLFNFSVSHHNLNPVFLDPTTMERGKELVATFPKISLLRLKENKSPLLYMFSCPG